MSVISQEKPKPHRIVDPGAEDHDPRLYETAVIAQTVNGLNALCDEHLDFYRQEGYLAVNDAFTPEEVAAAGQGLLDLIMGRNPDFNGVMFEAKAAERLDELSCEERQDAVRKLMHFVDYEANLAAMAAHPALLAAVARLLGEEPVLFQDMALIKPPNIGREKPWHQDHAYFDYPMGTKVVGVWIALDEATIANGCMHLQPQGHLSGPLPHFARRDWQICDTTIMGQPCVAAPLKPGGLLFFDGLLPHGTPTNHSKLRRKAVQFHYAGVSAKKVPREERPKEFQGRALGVEC